MGGIIVGMAKLGRLIEGEFMKRYELSIKATYLSNWGVFEGIRELVQNARDSEKQYDAAMSIKHDYRMRDKRPVGTLVITNTGVTIPRQALLIGHSSKQDRTDLIGQFGEGLKFGILALLRNGLSIKIRNGAETWNPVIVRSSVFDAEVLAIDVTEGNKFEERVSIEIFGIDLDSWEGMKGKFLFLTPRPSSQIVNVHGGRVLLGEADKGKVFVKGMFVARDERFYFGYDLSEADIDRDRRMISQPTYETSRLLAQALQQNLLTAKVYEMLKQSSPETEEMRRWSLSDDAISHLTNLFRIEYGTEAIPVESESEVTDLEHFGVRGVRVPYALRTILETELGTASSKLQVLRTNAGHVFALSDLDEQERSNYTWALGLLCRSATVLGMNPDGYHFRVVQFRDEQLLGTFEANQNCISIARSLLANKAKTLRVLIHELAHAHGRDGSKGHESAIGNLTEGVFNLMISN